MSEESTAVRHPPVHLWIVGVLSLLWNAYGCFDYLMKQTRNAGYLASLSAEQAAVITQMPVWVDVAWAIGVWAGLLGSALLLLRKRWATHAFRLSLLGAAIGTAYQVRALPATYVATTTEWVLTIAILMVCVVLLIYARWQTARGVLR